MRQAIDAGAIDPDLKFSPKGQELPSLCELAALVGARRANREAHLSGIAVGVLSELAQVLQKPS